MKEQQKDDKQERSFGLLVGGIFAAIGLWPLAIHWIEPRWWAVGLGAALILTGLAVPRLLYWPNKGWMLVGHLLGWINTRILLSIVFYLVVTPIGILRHWLGKDPMGQNLDQDSASYRVPRKPRPATHLMRQY